MNTICPGVRRGSLGTWVVTYVFGSLVSALVNQWCSHRRYSSEMSWAGCLAGLFRIEYRLGLVGGCQLVLLTGRGRLWLVLFPFSSSALTAFT